MQPEGNTVFNTLIVATDSTAGQDRAIGVAVSLARRNKLPVEVLSVVPPRRDSGGRGAGSQHARRS